MDTNAVLYKTGHRPWPLPQRPWALQMSWRDLAFLHWPIAPEEIRAVVPEPLEVDTFDGQAWIGVVPFRMADVRLRLAPPVPTAADFEELNVRTYVRSGERAGIWFLSLDAASRLVVRGARFTCNLPYFHAAMAARRSGEKIEYRSRRTHRHAPAAEFSGRYWPTGPVAPAWHGSLEHWLAERYCLFTVGRGDKVFQLDVHHRRWPLQPGAAEIGTNTMAEAAGVSLPAQPPLVHYAAKLDVLAWPPMKIARVDGERTGC